MSSKQSLLKAGKWAALCVMLTVVAMNGAGQAYAQKSMRSARPNVVFMLADNMGYGDLGVYGGGDTRGFKTPRIDRLAEEGLRFTQFLVEPGCTPTRAALLTGRYSIRAGLSLVIVPGTPNTLAKEEAYNEDEDRLTHYNYAHIRLSIRKYGDSSERCPPSILER